MQTFKVHSIQTLMQTFKVHSTQTLMQTFKVHSTQTLKQTFKLHSTQTLMLLEIKFKQTWDRSVFLTFFEGNRTLNFSYWNFYFVFIILFFIQRFYFIKIFFCSNLFLFKSFICAHQISGKPGIKRPVKNLLQCALACQNGGILGRRECNSGSKNKLASGQIKSLKIEINK